MSASEGGAGRLRSSAYMLITKPGVQKPHCEPCARARRSCTGCSPSRVFPMPARAGRPRRHTPRGRASRPRGLGAARRSPASALCALRCSAPRRPSGASDQRAPVRYALLCSTPASRRERPAGAGGAAAARALAGAPSESRSPPPPAPCTVTRAPARPRRAAPRGMRLHTNPCWGPCRRDIMRTLHGDDVHALHTVQRRQARVYGAVPQLAVRLAGHHDRARAAAALAAAQLGPGEALLCAPGARCLRPLAGHCGTQCARRSRAHSRQARLQVACSVRQAQAASAQHAAHTRSQATCYIICLMLTVYMGT
jgi:hypothetical protein